MLMTWYDEMWINRYYFFVRTFTGYCKDYLLYKGLVTDNSCKEQNDGYLEEIFCIWNASSNRLNWKKIFK